MQGYSIGDILCYVHQGVTRFTAEGEPMPRIPDQYLESVVYLYPKAIDAQQGERYGGSGCLVGISSSVKPQVVFVYAVTNSHVVRDGEGRCPIVRLNGKNGEPVVFEPPVNSWAHHPDGDDVAVCLIPGSVIRQAQVRVLPVGQFLTPGIIKRNDIGPGSDVFMAGRFINHQGIQKNTPSLRFGNISMMSPEPILHPTRGILQESFLVEMRSLTGYSGSPVVVYLPQMASFGDIRGDTVPHMAVFVDSSWLLGIVWGHSTWFERVREADRKTPVADGWTVATNSGIARVVPAWKIIECLEDKALAQQREEVDKELSKESTETTALDVNMPDLLTEIDF